MANPLKARGAKSLANLKRGGQKLPTAQKKAEIKEAQRISRKLLTDPQYRRRLIQRLRAGIIQPGVEALLWYYAFGKPTETIESNTPVPVTIIHQFEDEPEKPAKDRKSEK